MSPSLAQRGWIVPEPPPAEAAAALAGALGVPLPVARLLHGRGLRSAAEAAAFLDPPAPRDLFRLPGLRDAVGRLLRARAAGEGVLIFGDYDCDGVCSAALAAEALSHLGFRAAVHLPDRAEGYGMQAGTLPGLAAAAACTVVLAVDNGTTAHAAVDAARGAGIDVVVADHHQGDGTAPAAAAVVNPALDPGGPFAGLAGVGVVWALAQALAGELGAAAPPALDLVALGTIADVAPLSGVNRWLAREGLTAMAGAAIRPGLRALLSACAVPPGRAPGARDVSHGMAPRLNAPGRVDRPHAAYELLAARDEPAALAALAEVEACNRRRQDMGEALAAAAEAAAAAQPPGTRALVLADAAWHPGLVGPAASRLADRFGVPVLLAGIDARGICRGSGRGPGGWDLTAALRACRHLLVRFGGHAQAAGFEVEAGRLQALREALEALAPAARDGGAAGPPIRLDGELAPQDLDIALAEALERLHPFGLGNPEPAFLVRGASVAAARALGREDRHVRLQLRWTSAPAGTLPALGAATAAGTPGAGPADPEPPAGAARADLRPPAEAGRSAVERPLQASSGTGAPARGASIGAVGFGLGVWSEGLAAGGPFDLVARPEVDRYRGRASLQLVVADAAPSAGDWGPFVAAARRGLRRAHPDRDDLAAAFRRLRALAREGQLPPDPALLRELAAHCGGAEAAARAALLIFREVGLLDAGGRVQMPPGGAKVDLRESPRFRAAEAAWRAVERLAAAAGT